MPRYVLFPGDRLNMGESLLNGKYRFTMQNDANLVLYENDRPMWLSKTHGKATNCYLVMQKDGNLVIYDGSNKAIWASNTNRGNGNYVLVLQNDGNVVIYHNPIWSTGTHRA